MKGIGYQKFRNLKLIINKCFNVSFDKLACLVSRGFFDVFCLIFFTSSSDYDDHQTAWGDSVRVGFTTSLLIRFGDPLLEIWDAPKRTTIFFAANTDFETAFCGTRRRSYVDLLRRVLESNDLNGSNYQGWTDFYLGFRHDCF